MNDYMYTMYELGKLHMVRHEVLLSTSWIPILETFWRRYMFFILGPGELGSVIKEDGNIRLPRAALCI